MHSFSFTDTFDTVDVYCQEITRHRVFRHKCCSKGPGVISTRQRLIQGSHYRGHSTVNAPTLVCLQLKWAIVCKNVSHFFCFSCCNKAWKKGLRAVCMEVVSTEMSATDARISRGVTTRTLPGSVDSFLPRSRWFTEQQGIKNDSYCNDTALVKTAQKRYTRVEVPLFYSSGLFLVM